MKSHFGNDHLPLHDDKIFDLELPLVDELAKRVLMHRNAHFGGLFSVMLHYYQTEAKGISDEFDIEDVEDVDLMEKQFGVDLASFLLSESEQQHLQEAQKCYSYLQEIYDVKNASNTQPKYIAELILAETEEDELQAIAQVVSQGEAIVPALLQLLQTDHFYDPLFPGYGLAPALVAEALAQIGSEKSLPALFELSDVDNQEISEAALSALHRVKKLAMPFLLRILQSRPLTRDNQKAVNALLSFAGESSFAEVCLQQLEDPAIYANKHLTASLVLGCEALKEQRDQQKLYELCFALNFPKSAQQEFHFLNKQWKLPFYRVF